MTPAMFRGNPDIWDTEGLAQAELAAAHFKLIGGYIVNVYPSTGALWNVGVISKTKGQEIVATFAKCGCANLSENEKWECRYPYRAEDVMRMVDEWNERKG